MPDLPESPYAMALALARAIAAVERKPLGDPSAGADREYTLQLYRDRLKAVGNEGPRFTPGR
jgi:hypothetical protein